MGKKCIKSTKAQKKEADYERFIAYYETGMSVPEIEGELKRPRSTLYRWEKKYRNTVDSTEIETKRNDRKQQLVNDAWEGLHDLFATTKVLAAQLYDSQLVAKEIIEKLCEEGVSEEERKQLTERLKSLHTADVGELTALISMLYDKQAAASGESTAGDGTVKIVIEGAQASWGE